MTRLHTFPVLYDEVLTLSITNLKKFDYLKNNDIFKGEISWNIGGEKKSSISIIVNSISDSPYIELDYNYNGNPKNYKIPLVYILSNLKIGKIYYFKCPVTKKRCRKLYFVNGYFLHREAFKGMYKRQTESKKWRKTAKEFERYFGLEDIYEEIHKKSFRASYRGKPTRRYIGLLKKIEAYESGNIT